MAAISFREFCDGVDEGVSCLSAGERAKLISFGFYPLCVHIG